MKSYKLVFLAIFIMALFWAGCGLPSPSDVIIHTITPFPPSYSQIIYDCNTGDIVTPGNLIQPNPGCDSWELNRYERPFNPGSQDEFIDDLDILSAELGRDGNWFFLSIALYDLRPDSDYPEGTYAIEMDLDLDGRGDVLVLVREPGADGSTNYSVDGVQVWIDNNNDVGNQLILQPDPPYDGDGYDELPFNQGVGNDPDLAWARAIPGKPAYVEIAFKTSVIDDDSEFKWWVWSDQGVDDPSSFDYHDLFFHSDAGDVYQSQVYFPSNDIHELDNTCAAMWGVPPGEDPSLCVNDPNYPRPTPTPPGGRTFTPTPTGSLTITPTPPGWTPPSLVSRTPTNTPTPTPTRVGTYLPTWTFTPTNTPTNTPTSTPTAPCGQFRPCTPPPSSTPTTCPVGRLCVTPTPTVCSATQSNCPPTATATQRQ